MEDMKLQTGMGHEEGDEEREGDAQEGGASQKNLQNHYLNTMIKDHGNF